ncbi:MAG: hypothetical protein HYS32_00235 [Candidatus Woesearchaeota archaeon]|nr:MAG: hypothetical protein HYS32_00235 [Candidatus Woesearchaeota archaeon]
MAESRRDFLRKGPKRALAIAAGLSALGCTSLDDHLKKDVLAAPQDPPRQENPVPALERITEEKINQLMSRGSVDEILKEEHESGAITKLVYNTENPEETAREYKRLVFQEDVEAEKRRPILVMFHSNSDPSKRDAIIFKELERKYRSQVRFVTFKVDAEGDGVERTYRTFPRLLGINVRGPPSIAMFGRFDLLKGETAEENDERIKHLDILYGGPKSNEWIDDWLYGDNSSSDWVESNLIKPNGRYVVRLNNSATPQRKEIN